MQKRWRKSLNHFNKTDKLNKISSIKTWWQDWPPGSESMPNFFRMSPSFARRKKIKVSSNSLHHFLHRTISKSWLFCSWHCHLSSYSSQLRISQVHLVKCWIFFMMFVFRLSLRHYKFHTFPIINKIELIGLKFLEPICLELKYQTFREIFGTKNYWKPKIYWDLNFLRTQNYLS